MAMVYQPAARRHHRSVIAYTFGLLAVVGAVTTLVVVVRDPALSSTRLTTPVPAPEITVAGEEPPPGEGLGNDPSVPDDPFALGGPDPLDGPDALGGGPDTFGEPDQLDPGSAATGEPRTGTDADVRAGSAGTPHSAEDVRESLFWSGVFGLAISLAGLGLVGTRRRMW